MPEPSLDKRIKTVDNPLSEVDQLIADAEVAVTLAASEAKRGENEDIQTKKKISKEKMERAEYLQEWFGALKADDALVEDMGYEWVFDAAETETGIAAPEKTKETISALRKTGQALRKFSAIEPKSDALITKMESLKELHDKLFAQVQTTAVKALETIKKKYKGEKTEFEQRYNEMKDSPLVCGIEYNPNSPEAREKALKQEIIELFQRPVAEGRLKVINKLISEDKEKIKIMQEEHAVLTNPNIGQYPSDKTKIKLAFLNIRNGDSVYSLLEQIDYGIKNYTKNVELKEKLLSGNQLAFSTNQIVINQILSDEHDEEKLRVGLTVLRNYLNNLQRMDESKGISVDHPKNDFAKKIIGLYEMHGVAMPEGYSLTGHRELIIAEQLISKKEEMRGGLQNVSRKAESLSSVSGLGFLETQLPAVDRAIITKLWNNKEITPKNLKSNYEEIQNNHRLVLSPYDDDKRKEEVLKKVNKFFEEFPTAESLINKIFQGQGSLLNLKRAHEIVSNGLQGVKDRAKTAIPKEFLSAGWKESKAGALVEPGQDARKVDREYERLLEQLSAPQMSAEGVLDLRGSEGDFQVYTLGQAMDLLRRARRDAGKIIQESEKTGQGEAEVLKAQIENLKMEMGLLNERLVGETLKIAEQEGTISNLTTENQALNNKLTTARDKENTTAALNLALNNKINVMVAEIETALKEKAGWRGGALKEKIEKTLATIKKPGL